MLEHTTLSAGKGYAVTVYVPDDAVYRRLILSIEAIVPEAFAPVPVPEMVAQAIQRDVLPRASFPPFDVDSLPPADDSVWGALRNSPPPNCDGCIAQVETPQLNRDVEQEDDTGEPYVIPGCPTGACGLD